MSERPCGFVRDLAPDPLKSGNDISTRLWMASTNYNIEAVEWLLQDAQPGDLQVTKD